MSSPVPPAEDVQSILIVDGDVVSRHAIADYLRHCGYAVIEAATTDEALVALGSSSLSIDVILCDMAAIGTRSGFELAVWLRQNRPALEVRMAGSIDKVADAAADLCATGPHLARPYEPQAVVDYIKRLRATREQALT
jgi:CheY-like chemotaxis protein